MNHEYCSIKNFLTCFFSMTLFLVTSSTFGNRLQTMEFHIFGVPRYRQWKKISWCKRNFEMFNTSGVDWLMVAKHFRNRNGQVWFRNSKRMIICCSLTMSGNLIILYLRCGIFIFKGSRSSIYRGESNAVLPVNIGWKFPEIGNTREYLRSLNPRTLI